MTTRSIAQVVLVGVGLVIWGYGVRVDDPNTRWVGIACFAVATLLMVIGRIQRGRQE